MRAVEAVRDRRLPAHRPVVGRLPFGILAIHVLPVLGRADNAEVEGHNGVDRSRECQLHRASHLPGVVLPHGHHGAEHAHVVKLSAHPRLGVTRIRRPLATRATVEHPLPPLPEELAVLHVHFEAPVALVALVAVGHVDVVAHLALNRNVRHEALHRLGIDTWQVAGVRVPVGIAVAHVEQQDEVVAAADVGGRGRGGGHDWCSCPVLVFGSSAPDSASRAARRLVISALPCARWW